MAVDSFIPEVWAAELLTALPKAHVFAQGGLINTKYQGTIAQQGDTVHINTISAPTISTYSKGSTSISPETLTTSDQTLTIDQAKYFAFEVDDVDAAQAADDGALMTQAAELGADGLAQTTDSYLATLASTGGTALTAQDVGSADDAFLLMRNLRLKLDKNSVPTSGRWMVVSPEFYAVILGDSRFIDASKYGSNAPILNGEIGQAIGFRILMSNNLPEGTAGDAGEVSNYVIAGHQIAWTYAEQINKVEAYRPESSFSDALKGLHLYGAKVTEKDALVVCDVDVTVA